MLNLPLTKPLLVGGKTFSELVLRDVEARDALRLGIPHLLISQENHNVIGLEIRPKVLVAYISCLASIPKHCVQEMAMADISQCQAFVMSFFGGEGHASWQRSRWWICCAHTNR